MINGVLETREILYKNCSVELGNNFMKVLQNKRLSVRGWSLDKDKCVNVIQSN
jgi:hypothetical protein